MKKVVLSVVAALAVSAAMPAFAADMPAKAPKVVAPAPPPSPWDIAFGAGIMNDYIFRGVTQSGHKGSVAAYFEPRYNINTNWQLYAGLSGESIKFANNAAAEIDFYGGVRSTWGPVVFDVGVWEYYYPGGNCYAVGVVTFPDTTCLPALFPTGNVAKSVA
ncbi:MAG: TorF family putative porin, partial [Pseudolabrys sp.]